MTDDTRYELVHAPTPQELSREVLDRVEHGWWPLGTAFVHGEHYIQAMVQGQLSEEPAVAVGDER